MSYKVLDIDFEDISSDYVLIPRKVLKQCERMTRFITISSNIPDFSTKQNRQAKSFQSTIDYMKKNKIEIL